MKKLLLIIAIALLLSQIVQAVRIEEIYYDPINSETNGEALVLFNPENENVDISNWTIRSHKLAIDITIPENTKIKANNYFLITDKGWDEGKDNKEWPSSDYEEALSLGNTDYGIGLYDKNEQLIDKVGWGKKENIENNMYYLNPASKVITGNSLLRISDTNNNSNDFRESEPLMKSSTSSQKQENLNFVFSINSNETKLLSYEFLEDDFSDEGIQLIPNPGEERTIIINFILENSNNYTNINEIFLENKSLNFIKIINKTSALYQVNFTINYDTQPKNYTLQLSTGEKINYEVKELVALEIDSINFEINSKKEQELIIEGDLNLSTSDKPTIKNIGNVKIDIGIRSTNLANEFKALSVENIMYSFDENDFTSSLSGTLSENKSLIDINLIPGVLKELGFKINIPSNVSDGFYENNIILSAVRSE